MNPSANPLLERCNNIMCLLQDATIDMSQEKAQLEALFGTPQQETLLVVGDSQAAPYTLLPWEEQFFEEQDLIPFPLVVQFDDTFSIEITAEDGTPERYRTIADFRSFCKPRFSQIRHCAIRLPQKMLRQRTLIYFQIDGNLTQLAAIAKNCTGCIMVLEARAGGLSEDYLSLGHWLTKERCIAPRTVLLLHYHSRLSNMALPMMAEQMLGRNKLTVFSCGIGKRDLLPVTTALDYAILDLQDRSLDGMDEGILRSCCDKAQEKLLAAIQKADEQEKKYRGLANRYQDAGDTFQRMFTTELQGLSHIFTEEEQENVCSEIKDFFKEVRNSLPAMIDHVTETSPNAKEDLKNLAGDYLNDLLDSFTDTLLNELSAKYLVPRTQNAFQGVCGRFRRLMQDPQLEYAQLEAEVELEFLQMTNINIGNYQNASAQLTSTLFSSVLQLILSKKYGMLGYNIAKNLREIVQYFFVERRYVRDLTKHLLETLDEQETHILEQLRHSIFPRLIHVLQDEFDELGSVYYRLLRRRYEEYDNKANKAATELTHHKYIWDQLAALNPDDPAAKND